MTVYVAPTRDMKFVIEELAGLDEVAALPDYQDLGVNDVAGAILEEAGKFASEVIATLNWQTNQEGAHLDGDHVVAPKGFKGVYQQFSEGGWNGLAAPVDFGGQGLPELLNTPTYEMWNASNMSFALAPLLGAGATECIKHHGSDEQKELYLPRMIAGEWAGTMDLTEPQAGSDLSNVKCKAVPEGDHYRLTGTKIFITWGDHDMTENIIHLALARLPDAPEGVRGISLFLVPKYLVNPDGSLGEFNNIKCVGIEHKLGIHASATCSLAYEDSIGYLVGKPNMGLMHMFTMMNEARLKVGVQGLAIAERAYQAARLYASERVQGFSMKGARGGDRVTIIHHPDVRRMLMAMKSQIEAMRAVNYVIAMHMDMANHHPDPEVRKNHQTRLDLLIPVTKGWCSEVGVELTSLAIQVYGGMGFVEESRVAQHFRDSRIATIYEGTTGIQAADLVGRKLVQDKGAAMASLIADMRATEEELGGAAGDDLAAIRSSLSEGIKALASSTDVMLSTMAEDPSAAMANSVNYLMLAGYVDGGWQMARAAIAANRKLAAGEDTDFYEAKLITARFYADQVLPKATALAQAVKAGGHSTLALAEERF